MALAAVSAILPTCFGYGQAGAPGYTALAMSASTHQVAAIVQVPKTGNIHKIYFRLGTTTTGDTLNLGLFTVDTTGKPTTTAYGGMAVGTLVVANGDDNVSASITLATDAAATVDDLVAIVIKFNSYVAGNLNIDSFSLGSNSARTFPRVARTVDTGTNWTKSSFNPCMAIEYDDGTFAYAEGVYPFTSGISSNNVSSTGTFRELAAKISLPIPCTTKGVIGSIGCSTDAADFDLILYDSSTSALSTKNIVGESFSSTSTRQASVTQPATDVSASTTYRMSVKASSATNVVVYSGAAPSAAALEQVTGLSGGTGYCLSTRDSGGTWTDTTSAMPLFGLLVSKFSDGAGGGGLAANPLRGFL